LQRRHPWRAQFADDVLDHISIEGKVSPLPDAVVVEAEGLVAGGLGFIGRAALAQQEGLPFIDTAQSLVGLRQQPGVVGNVELAEVGLQRGDGLVDVGFGRGRSPP